MMKGYDAIPKRLLEKLVMLDKIEKMSYDLYHKRKIV